MSKYIEQFWRDATAADVARVMNGKKVEARFRDDERQEWKPDQTLAGWTTHRRYPWKGGAHCWTYCQVYDPPQWFLEKPEPGEGYRLLRKFPDEAKLPTDEIFITELRFWRQPAGDDSMQEEGYWYRREIEQPKPEPKYTVGQQVKIVGPKERPAENWYREMDFYIGQTETVKVLESWSFGVMYQVTNAIGWAFQEDYLELEPVVEPKHYVLQVGDTAETESGLRLTVTEHGVEVQ